MRNRKVSAICIWLWSFIFGHLETAMFGWNLFPKTIEELICDGIALATFFYAVYLFTTKPNQ